MIDLGASIITISSKRGVDCFKRLRRSQYLSKGSFANEWIDFVPVEETLAVTDDVIVIVIIVAVIVEFALLLVLRILTLRLLRPALLLCIVNLINWNRSDGISMVSHDTFAKM